MIHFFKFLILFSVFMGSVKCTMGQNKFHICIQIPDTLGNRKILCTYDDGIKLTNVTDTFSQNKLNISGVFYGKYATLKVDYIINDSVYFFNDYLIGTKPAKLCFWENKENIATAPFKNCTLSNAIEVNKTVFSKERSRFSQKEIEEMNVFWDKYGNSMRGNDSLTAIFNQRLYNLNRRDLQFIIKNPKDYLSFWFFRTAIIPGTIAIGNKDKSEFFRLLKIFNTKFPYQFTSSVEGKATKELLEGKLYASKNTIPQNFSATDITGKKIQLKDFRGKFVLLNFWATWCPPCMAEIPAIKQIRDSYGINKLQIIGISLDHNYVQFNNAIKKNNMNWIHIYSNEHLVHAFDVETIPSIFLIDMEGLMLYHSKEVSIDTLTEMLGKM